MKSLKENIKFHRDKKDKRKKEKMRQIEHKLLVSQNLINSIITLNVTHLTHQIKIRNCQIGGISKN